MDDEQLPLVHRDGSGGGDSLQQQLSSYHDRQRSRQQRRHRSKTLGRATVGLLAASLLTLLLVVLSWPAHQNERALELHALMDAYQHAKNFSGVVRLSHNGQKKMQQAMGEASVQFKLPMEEHSVFPMGAHIQLLTAVAMHQLQEKGLVQLDNPVAQYLTPKDWDEFQVKNETTWCPKLKMDNECQQVTFQHLLYMGSGVHSQIKEEGGKVESLGSFGQQVGRFINAPLAFNPGTSYMYADENYVLLAYMVEKLSGLSFVQYLQKHIFQPVNMKLTTFDPYAGALGVRRGLVDQYVQFYAHRHANVSDRSESSSGSSSGPEVVVEKHMHRMATGSCAIYQDFDSSLHGLQSTGKDMHKLYNDLFHDQGRHSKLLKAKSIEQLVHTRNPAFPSFAQGIGVDFDETQSELTTSEWPAKIAFCGSTACSTTCMAMQMPSTNMSIVASAFTNDVRLYFPSLDAFEAYKPRDFIEKREPTVANHSFEKNDGEVNTLAWNLLQVFLRFYTADN